MSITSGWETIIGLEVHAQLATKTKLWCNCSTAFGSEPNTQTCEICLGHPGTLPVLNTKAVDFAIQAGLALGCQIRERSVFARKNYFYPDLPKGYQISQYEFPICEKGTLDLHFATHTKTVGITRIHIEEDAAKNIHGAGGDGQSVIDYNRGGTPLIEIVSEPDMRSSDEAVEYYKTLRAILVFLGINDGNMEEGSLRCDANVSVRKIGEPKFRTRVELKNINSFRFLKNAIEYETVRQIEAYNNGETMIQETRLWDNAKGESRAMRAKGEANDYRYFPEPDLIPLILAPQRIESFKQSLPELPQAKAKRYQTAHGVAAADAEVVCQSPEFAAFFDQCLLHTTDGKRLGNWFVGEFSRVLNEKITTLQTLKFSPIQFASLLKMVESGQIAANAAKETFLAMVKEGVDPERYVQEKGLAQVSDVGAVDAAVDKVLAANGGEVEKYRAGKKAVIGFLLGQVMREMKGKGNPAIVNETMLRKLGS